MKRKGYTLIETLIVILITGLLFNALFDVLNFSSSSFNSGYIQQTVENQARQGLDAMERELYQTNRTNVVFSDANATITFKIPVRYDYVGGVGRIFWGAEGVENQQIRYTIDNKQLVRRVLDVANNLVSQRVLAVDIQTLGFDIVADNMLTVTLIAQEPTYDGKIAAGKRAISQGFFREITFRN